MEKKNHLGITLYKSNFSKKDWKNICNAFELPKKNKRYLLSTRKYCFNRTKGAKLMTKPVYPNPIPKHLQHLPEWKLRCLFYLFRSR